MQDTDGARIYRRHIRLDAHGRQVAGELADDAQHFRVRLRHDGARVIAVDGEAVRHPWSTCAEARDPLRDLEGMPLSRRCTAVGEVSNARHHCTHWFDLAGLAVAHAASARASREYRCAVWGASGEITTATLERDGEPLLVWRLEGMTIHGASPFDGRSLKGAFQSWAEAELDADLAEAAIVLRRAAYISPVRFYDLDRFERPGDVTPIGGQCFTYTEGTAQRAERQIGSLRDYTNRPEALLSEATAGSGSA
jgi:hypothetical protein